MKLIVKKSMKERLQEETGIIEDLRKVSLKLPFSRMCYCYLLLMPFKTIR
jgi:hypothetical protein